MRVQVKKWGNSASVSIPAQVMSAAALHVGQAVDIRVEGGRVIIEPIVPATYELDDLLERMTPDTFHDEVNFGAPVGDEAWRAPMSPTPGTSSGCSSIPRRVTSRQDIARHWCSRRRATTRRGA